MIIDILALVMLLWCGRYFSKKGLIYSVLNACSFLISVMTTFFFYEKFALFLKNGPLGKLLTDALSVRVAEEMVQANGGYIKGIPKFIQDIVLKSEEIVSSGAVVIAEMITGLLLTILAIILLFILSKIVVSLLIKLIDVCAKLPFLKQANKSLGFICGILIGVVWLYVILAVISFFSFTKPIAGIVNFIEMSRYVIEMYNNNFILNLFL